MSVKFTAVQKQQNDKSWYIELTDTMENKTIKCENLEQFSQQIELLGAEYGNDIEVVWSCDNDVSPLCMQELRVAMMTYQDKYQDEIDKEFENKDTTL
jgi:hypothetical protein